MNEEIKLEFDWTGYGIFLIAGVLLGVSGTLGWQSYEYQRSFNGLWVPENQAHTQPSAIKIAQTFDSVGNWVCVNVRDMNYKQVVETCKHEAGHELFAKLCENNSTRCEELIS